MLKLRTDTAYVGQDGKLTQAGVEAFQGLLDAQAKNIAANAADIAILQAADATEAANAPGAAPRYACRAWVNFNGTGTVAIRASGNVASITDNGSGDYTINFTTAMPDADYAYALSGENVTGGGNPKGVIVGAPGGRAAGSLRILCFDNTFTPRDHAHVCVAVFR